MPSLRKRVCVRADIEHVHACCYRDCKDAPLRSTTKVVYHWQVEGADPMEHRTLACKMLHCAGKSNVPRPLKVPLLCSILPEAIKEPKPKAEKVHLEMHAISPPIWPRGKSGPSGYYHNRLIWHSAHVAIQGGRVILFTLHRL